jgi:hypothetical protein
MAASSIENVNRGRNRVSGYDFYSVWGTFTFFVIVYRSFLTLIQFFSLRIFMQTCEFILL